ncbi:MAG: ATP-dependent zinc metalloprotease FtsH [Actinomycetota bacterium]
MPEQDRNPFGRRPPPGSAQPRPRSALLVVLLVAGALFVFNSFLTQAGVQEMSFSEFRSAVDEGNLSKDEPVTITTTNVTGVVGTGEGAQTFVATIPPGYDPTRLVDQLSDQGYEVDGTQPNALTGFIVQTVLFIALFGGLYYFLFRRIGGGASSALNLGRNKVKIYDRKEMKTSFVDVAGVDEAKEELREIVDFLKNPKKYQRLGGRIPKGVLLLGPPGCGKTLLARAVAGEANVPFFFMSGSEFVEMFVGLGAARVRELFQQAKEKAPALVFLDEIDTIGKGRAGPMSGSFGGHDEREQTLNQLLVEMDGFDASKGVIIMAATNRPDVLDPALIRPGRFDRQVVVDPPDLNGREEILRVHARGVALDTTVDLRTIAARTPGFTGADLENVVNEAALLAARREKNAVTMEELEEAIDRATAGLERKSRVVSDKQKERVAVHEMGHALVALHCDEIDPLHRVTIIPRGAAALGITMTRPLEDRYVVTEPQLKDQMAFAMGGQAAEEIYFHGVISTGAQNDLEKATDLARAMVSQFGMSDAVGPVSLGRDDPNAWMPGSVPKVSAHTSELIDKEVRRLLDEAHVRAEKILNENRELLNELSALLIATEVIDGDELKAYVEGRKEIPDPATVRPTPPPERSTEPETVPAEPGVGVRAISLPPAPPMPATD